MTVIAMTREMGTRGKDVAAIVAETLGLEIVHHEIVEQHVAEKLDISESAVHRFLEGEASLWERWKINRDRLSRYTAVEILELAMNGNVIIRGWGAAQLLKSIPHVSCVRVCAPMNARIAEMKRRMGIDDNDVVRREIERSDSAHERLVKARFNLDWRDPTGYDLSINTDRVPIELCADHVCRLANAPDREESEHSRNLLKDRLVTERVRMTLSDDGRFGAVGGGLEVIAVNGEVTLRGFVHSAGGLDDLLAKLKLIDGVNRVIDEIQILPMAHSPYGP